MVGEGKLENNSDFLLFLGGVGGGGGGGGGGGVGLGWHHKISLVQKVNQPYK